MRRSTGLIVWLVVASMLVVGLAFSWLSTRAMARLVRAHAEALLPAHLGMAEQVVASWSAAQQLDLEQLAQRIASRNQLDLSVELGAAQAWWALALCERAATQYADGRAESASVRSVPGWRMRALAVRVPFDAQANLCSVLDPRDWVVDWLADWVAVSGSDSRVPWAHVSPRIGMPLVYSAPLDAAGSVWIVARGDPGDLEARFAELSHRLASFARAQPSHSGPGASLLRWRFRFVDEVSAASRHRLEVDRDPRLGTILRASQELPAYGGSVVAELPTRSLLLPVRGAIEAATVLLCVALALGLCSAVYLSQSLSRSRRELEHRQARIEAANAELSERNRELRELNQRLERLSITDGLTQLHNHRYFQEQLTREIVRAQRDGAPLYLLLMDVDHFKQLNDTYGHAVGDQVLRGVARLMQETTRPGDLLARYGGEEFALVPRQVSLEGAIKIAEKIRLAIASKRFEIGPTDSETRTLQVTVSIGIAGYAGHRSEFFEAADRALYQAKANGRDCVNLATGVMAP